MQQQQLQAPPPCWTACPLIGQPVANTPFITCKTPITSAAHAQASASSAPAAQPDADNSSGSTSSSSLASDAASSSSALPLWDVAAEFTFTLSMLLRHQQRQGRAVGLIVDLTDGRFYDPQPLCQQHDVTYINMYIPPAPPSSSFSSSSSSSSAHLAYPLPASYLATLFRVLSSQLERAPDRHIVLHDIYSFDLSLSLIALFLIDGGCAPSLAFQTVCASRPPGISNAALVQRLYSEGAEELEFDTAVLERPAWCDDGIWNWTWSGVGDREESRRQRWEGGEKQQLNGMKEEKKDSGAPEEKEEKKDSEAVRPAGGIRRKVKKSSAAPPAAASKSSAPLSSAAGAAVSLSPSPSQSPLAAPSDPYTAMLADMGVVAAPAAASSSPAPQPPQPVRKRKAPFAPAASASPARVPTSSPPSASRPAASPPAQPIASSSSASLPLHKQHSYLVAVQPPHLQRLLSTLLTLVLSPASHYSSSSFPSLSPTDIRAKLVMLSSWHDKQPLTRAALQQMAQQPAAYTLSWTPLAQQCLLLILKEGSFLLPLSSSSLASLSSSSALPPLYHVPHLSFPSRSAPGAVVSNTVAIGALLFDVASPPSAAAPIPRLLLTDLLSSASHHPLPASITRRLQLLDSEVVLPRAQRRSVGEGEVCALHVRCKKHWPLSKIGSVMAMDVPHEKEGLEMTLENGEARRGGRIWLWRTADALLPEAELLAALKS